MFRLIGYYPYIEAIVKSKTIPEVSHYRPERRISPMRTYVSVYNRPRCRAVCAALQVNQHVPGVAGAEGVRRQGTAGVPRSAAFEACLRCS